MPEQGQGYDPLAIANYLIDLSLQAHDGTEASKGIYLTKLIKLVYICHGMSLAHLNKPLVNEPVEAGDFGPYFTSIYRMLKDYALSEKLTIRKITEKATAMGIEITAPFKSNEKDLIKNVYEKFKNVSGSNLSWLTHKEGSPWSETQKYENIKNENIKTFYQQILNGQDVSQMETHKLTAL